MRTHQWRTLALAATLGMGAAGAQAALQGRDLDGNAATFEAYYDTTQNISWLADTGLYQLGAIPWSNAVLFLRELNVHGVTGWRLPKTPVLDATCSIQGGSFSGGLRCAGSEIGHLFEVDGISVANPAGFLNLGGVGDSWSADGFIDPQSQNEYKFVYVFIRSFTGIANPSAGHGAWAVHDGDVGNAVAAVPEPGTYVMMLGGLLALGAVARRRKPR